MGRELSENDERAPAIPPTLEEVRASVVDVFLSNHSDERFFDDYVRHQRGALLLHTTHQQMQEFERFNAESYINGLMTPARRARFESIWNWKTTVIPRHQKRLLHGKLSGEKAGKDEEKEERTSRSECL